MADDVVDARIAALEQRVSSLNAQVARTAAALGALASFICLAAPKARDRLTSEIVAAEQSAAHNGQEYAAAVFGGALRFIKGADLS